MLKYRLFFGCNFYAACNDTSIAYQPTKYGGILYVLMLIEYDISMSYGGGLRYLIAICNKKQSVQSGCF